MDIKTVPYGPVFCRSCFSLLKGVLTPEEIVDTAKQQGWSFAGMVDKNNVYGIIRFLLACSRNEIKPVCGVELSGENSSSVIAYILNRGGFSKVCDFLTRRFTAVSQDLPLPDPISFFCAKGWNGLWLVSQSQTDLLRLSGLGTDRLFAGLEYGMPFRQMLRWARSNRLPVFAYNRAVWRGDEDRKLYQLLGAVDRNILFERVPKEYRAQDHENWVSAAAMRKWFSSVPEALWAPYQLSRESEAGDLLCDSFIFPAFEGLSESQAFSQLKTLCSLGITRRYGEIRPEISDRLDHELRIIRDKGFSSYFLVVQDIVSQFPRTCGRGSSAASIVSYLLGITHVDPLKYNLFFERFLHMGRKDPPDIDMDFPWDEREKALQYVFSKYKGRCGMVADHVTFGPRSSVREPAKAFGVPEEEIGKIVELVRRGYHESVPAYILKAAKRLKGLPRYIGTHPGGVVITPGPITNYTHVQISPLGYPVIAWEKDAAEEAGLVKIDLLGNRSLGVLRDSLSLINKTRQNQLYWDLFCPIDEKETKTEIEQGNTLGVFYVESPATRQLLKKMGSGSYEHLVVASSIIRPAANAYINEFVERLHGKPVPSVHPLVDPVLEDTLGIMVYQEDVSRIAIAAAGFSPSEADSLRKVLSKKDRELRLPAFKERFFQGAAKNGIPLQTVQQLWDGVLSFDGYSFCKPHSASYALVSYKLAWVKHYYPLEFAASVINNGGGFYNRQVYINETRRMGFLIKGPDINKSKWRYSTDEGVLRTGLCQLKEVDEPFLRKVLKNREASGLYQGIFDFIDRVRPGFAQMRILIRAGALDSVSNGMTRPQMFWLYFTASESRGLFGPPRPPETIEDYTKMRKILDEIYTLDLLVSFHPLRLFLRRMKNLLCKYGLPEAVTSELLCSRVNTRVCIAGTRVTAKEVVAKTNKPMCFVSFEDQYGIFETVVFPGVYEKYQEILEKAAAQCLVGMVKSDHGAVSLHIEHTIALTREEYLINPVCYETIQEDNRTGGSGSENHHSLRA
ncbi:MAG: PHP domain-containing protein [Spirochaetia bacterium]